jgi:predicted Zn-dependent peptidase
MAVHDKESKVTAVTVSVNVGAAADPKELNGLAHFAEHMCFLGSEKYPGENEVRNSADINLHVLSPFEQGSLPLTLTLTLTLTHVASSDSTNGIYPLMEDARTVGST